MMPKKKILLTVPHGCVSEPNCDFKADLIAAKTFEILAAEQFPYELEVLINKLPRSIIDMNRPEARGTSFRKEIDDIIKENDIILFDVHTFPNGTNNWFFEVGVFDLPPRKDNKFIKQLVSLFDKAGFNTKRVNVSSRLNDIAECLQCDAEDDAVLLEFNEKVDIESTASRFAKIIKKVAEEKFQSLQE